jgi:predicted nucleic acid-binding protein
VIVVDTNILVHFKVTTPLSSAAQAIFDADPAWYAPYLWRSEFRNALAVRMRHEHLPLAEALLWIREAEDHMYGRERFVDPEQVMRLVATSTCTAYDCEFVALAQELGVPLITTDKQIIRDFPQIARAPADYR